MLAIVLAATLLSSPQAAPRVPAITNAEACLREKASTAVSASAGAADAAEFLLDYLCAGAVQKAVFWQLNTDVLANMKSVVESMRNDAVASGIESGEDGEEPTASTFSNIFGDFDSVSVDPVTGEFVVNPASTSLSATTLRSQSSAYSQMAGNKTPAFLRELAAQVVMEARAR